MTTKKPAPKKSVKKPAPKTTSANVIPAASPASGERTASVQYRVIFGKKDEVVEGPDDAELVITVAAGDVGSDPTSLYMQGKLKASGGSGALFERLRSGEIASVLRRLASRS